MRIGRHSIGKGAPAFVIAEVSANHHQSIDEAERIIRAAHQAGANAVKLQTYTADTLTIRCDNAHFRISGGTLWDGYTLHDLYAQAYTPWEWHPPLKAIADELGLEFFSTPFDSSAVEFLEAMDVPAYKVASFELVDLGLIREVARTGKPLIISTGMATLSEIQEAVEAARHAGAEQIALLKCTSAYPARPEEMNLRTIPHLAETFAVPVGISDHTAGTAVPIAAIALGASIVEKHLTISRSVPGPDSAFSLEPLEFKLMVDEIRIAEKAIGNISYGISESEEASRRFRRSLFVIESIKAGEIFTLQNVRSIRPGYGLHTRHLEEVIGRRAVCDIERGTPLSWNLVSRS
jgi:pseudaminic acid synthase